MPYLVVSLVPAERYALLQSACDGHTLDNVIVSLNVNLSSRYTHSHPITLTLCQTGSPW